MAPLFRAASSSLLGMAGYPTPALTAESRTRVPVTPDRATHPSTRMRGQATRGQAMRGQAMRDAAGLGNVRPILRRSWSDATVRLGVGSCFFGRQSRLSSHASAGAEGAGPLGAGNPAVEHALVAPATRPI